MKQYSLFTVLNSAYMPFGKIWINSLHEHLEMENVKSIFILDTGLTVSDREYLTTFDKVEIVSSDINLPITSDANVDNSPWLQHVLRKTKFFNLVLKKGNYPLVMVDSDCMFIGDIAKYLDNAYDIQVCNRSYHEYDDWIASFFVAHNADRAAKFMKLWISRMRKLMQEAPERKWFESKSLNLLLNELREEKPEQIKIGDVFTKNVACEELPYFDAGETSVLHFKGTTTKTDFNGRINRFNSIVNVTSKIREYLKTGV
tara:strand:+ start:2552 stop:3325 length:774 start_codon:yes stop_codon:yes gene_type:complete